MKLNLISVFVLFATILITSKDSYSFDHSEKSGLTLKGMSESIYNAENQGKFRLRMNTADNDLPDLETIEYSASLNGRVVLNTNDKHSYEFSRSSLLTGKKPDIRVDEIDISKLFPQNYKPWESTRHFGLAVGEGALFNIFIPWALARWGRDWDTVTVERWPFIGWQSIWGNLQNGWNYDGDNFLTNMFSHPYGGNLFFNSGRTNGYNFWESSAFALTGSFLWETFMETNAPAINDWVNTGMNGAAFGEVLYRLSNLVTDNTARGSHRVWTEIAGGIINPVRLFTRLVTGEASRVFPNPSIRKPSNLLIGLDAGTRVLLEEDATHNPDTKELQGLFELVIRYGDPTKLKHSIPFSHFDYNLTFASSSPNLTSMGIRGSLFSVELANTEKVDHSLETVLSYQYVNNPGFLYGNTGISEYLNSYFDFGKSSGIKTKLGVKLIAMGSTPNDYFYDTLDGRQYDFGQGLGCYGSAALFNGTWEVFNIFYQMDYIWTQSQPNNSKHFLQAGAVSLQLPLRDYFVVGIGAGYYKRISYYSYPPGYFGFNIPGKPETNAPDVRYQTPIVRVFFKTRIL